MEHHDDEKQIKQIEEALKRIFAFGEENQRFIDVSRIPLICQSIVQMSDSIKRIDERLDQKVVSKEQFDLVARLVYGGVSVVLLAVLGALVALVLK